MYCFYGFYIIFELKIALSIKEQNKKEGVLNKKICGYIFSNHRIIDYCWDSNLLFIL